MSGQVIGSPGGLEVPGGGVRHRRCLCSDCTLRFLPVVRCHGARTLKRSHHCDNQQHLDCQRGAVVCINYVDPVASLAIALMPAAIALTAGSRCAPNLWRLASQLGSLYESQVLPVLSCQTNAFSGRSIPII